MLESFRTEQSRILGGVVQYSREMERDMRQRSRRANAKHATRLKRESAVATKPDRPEQHVDHDHPHGRQDQAFCNQHGGQDGQTTAGGPGEAENDSAQPELIDWECG